MKIRVPSWRRSIWSYSRGQGTNAGLSTPSPASLVPPGPSESLTRTNQHPDPSPPLSPGARLPPELLNEILTFLTFAIYPSAFSFAGLLPDAVIRVVEIVDRHDALKPLSNAILVSKSWYQAGTRLLYSTIFLTSHSQVRILGRTLKHNPSLGPMIKRLFFLQDTHGGSNPTPRSGLKRFRISTKVDLRQVLVSILRSCTSLESLTSTYYGSEHLFPPWDQDFIDKSSVGSHIRALSMCGDWTMGHRKLSPKALLPPSTFPVLEVLQLHGAYFDSSTTIPLLPSLHTLLISSPTPPTPSLTINTSELPSLKALRLSSINVPVSFTGNALQGLESIWVDGREEFEALQVGVRQGRMNSLKHVVVNLDAIRSESSGMPTLYIPPRIETLAFDLNFPFSKPHTVLWLEAFSNTSHVWSRRYPHFEKVVIEYGSNRGHDLSEFERVVEKIRIAGELVGVSVEVRQFTPDQHAERGWYYMYDWPLGLFNDMDRVRLR